MKNHSITIKTLLLPVFCFSFAVSGFSQSKPYWTTGGEIIFSMGNIDYKGDMNPGLRFAPVFNLQGNLNKDFNKKFGLFTGLALRNVGYIVNGYKDPSDNLLYKKKFRSYNLGVPLGFKIGTVDQCFFYGGYEVEVAMAYKEKTFEGRDKTSKITGWFSDRQELFQHGFFAGVQFPYGGNLKFKYYVSEFHNRNFTNSNGVKPYAGLKTNVFYFSLSFFIFKNTKVYYYHNRSAE